MPRTVRAAAAVTAAVGAASLVCWFSGQSHYLGTDVGVPVITPLTAILFLLASVALLPQRTSVRHVALSVTGALFLCMSVARAAEYLSGGRFTAELLVGLPYDRAHRSSLFVGVVTQLILGSTPFLLFSSNPSVGKIGSFVATFGMLAAAMSVAGYAYNAFGMFFGLRLNSISLLAAIASFAYLGALLLDNPAGCWTGNLTRDDLGGAVARRLIGLNVLSAVLIGVALEISDKVWGIPLQVAFSGVLLFGLAGPVCTVWWVVKFIDRIEAGRLAETEQKAAALSMLGESENRRNVAETLAGAATWEIDLANDSLVASGALCPLYGLPDDTVMTSSLLRQMRHPADSRIDGLETVTAERPLNTSYRIIRQSDGQVRWMQVTAHRADRDGRKLIVGFSIDVTDNRKAAQDAEAARTSRARFIGQLVHQLAQPIQSMTLFVPLIRQNSPLGVGYLLDGIDTAQDDLTTILDALRETHAHDTGKTVFTPEVLCLAEVLGPIAAEYSLIAQKASIKMSYTPSTLWVRTDPAVIHRIVRILLDNSVECAGGCKIVFGVRRMKGKVRITVADSGIGIPEALQHRIFDDFFQLPPREKLSNQSRGLGLGLTAATRLASVIGTRLDFTSVEGRGTVFFFDLPTVKAPYQARPSPMRILRSRMVNVPDTSSERMVVVIEDSGVVRDSIAASLKQWGYSVVQAASAESAVTQLAGTTPDLVIADYHLNGGLTGLDAIRIVRDVTKWKVPGMLMTADLEVSRRQDVRSSGIVCLEKPVPPVDLRSAVESLLQETASYRS